MNAVSILLCGIVNVSLVAILVKYTELGLVAIASISAIITVLRYMVVSIPYAARLLKLKWYTFYKDVLISCLCCFVNSAFCFIFKSIITPTSWIMMIVSVFCACAVSFCILFVLLISKDERKKIIAKFMKKST